MASLALMSGTYQSSVSNKIGRDVVATLACLSTVDSLSLCATSSFFTLIYFLPNICRRSPPTVSTVENKWLSRHYHDSGVNNISKIHSCKQEATWVEVRTPASQKVESVKWIFRSILTGPKATSV